MTSSATYHSGNRLATTTDAAGNVTTYNYDANTNALLSVQYPNGGQTSYTYDNMYRLASAAASTGTQTLSANYTYADDMLTKITTGSTTYNFAYGHFALRSSIKVGSATLASYSYTSRNNYLNTLAYGNGDAVQYAYDNLGRVTTETYEDGDTVSYQYDNDGALATITDSATGRKTTYYYDFTDRLMKYVESGNNFHHSVGYTYDSLNNLTALKEVINGTTLTTSYAYDDDNRVTSVTNGNAGKAYTYDGLGRVSQRVTKHGSSTIATDTLTYRTVNGKATGQVSSLATKVGTYSYTYDANGNIKTVGFGGYTTTYTYDAQNQLTREDNQAAGRTWVWTYDDAGNIQSRKEYSYTTGTLGSVLDTVDYSYGNSNWGDLLTAYDGVSITHDGIGNPLTDGTWTYTWEHGRELASMSGGGTTWTFTYDANGMRTKRTNGSTTYNYVYNGGSLSQMTVGGNTLNFAYDASGTPMAVTYNGTNYYYVTNLQGDVTAILNSSGTKVVAYTYDAWGKLLSTSGSMASTLGVHNPLRYRGYVYDTETELYYLQSRYYDPEVGRFINADAFVSTGQGLPGNNMFAYCNNNPSTKEDPFGAICVTCYSDDLFLNNYESTGGGGGGYTGAAFAHQYAKDAQGGYSLAEASSTNNGITGHAKAVSCEYDFFAITDQGVEVASIDAAVLTASISVPIGPVNATVTPIDMLGVDVSAGLYKGGVEAGAIAYVYAATGSLQFGTVEIAITRYWGAVGGKFVAKRGEVTLGIASGVLGGSLSIKWTD